MQICNAIIFQRMFEISENSASHLLFICRSWCMQLKWHLKIYNNKIIIRNLLLVLSINLKSNKINIKKGKQGKFWILPIDGALVLNSINDGALVLKSANKGPTPLHKMITLRCQINEWARLAVALFSSCYTYELNIATANRAHSFIRLTRERYRTAKRSLRSKTIREWNKLNR